MSMSVPPRQAISAGWTLLTRGLWYWVTRRDMWIGVSFEEK